MNVLQVWRCKICKRLRHWGFGFPSDFPSAEMLPSLYCDHCFTARRHEFHQVHTTREDRAVNWGEWKPVESKTGWRHIVRTA